MRHIKCLAQCLTLYAQTRAYIPGMSMSRPSFLLEPINFLPVSNHYVIFHIKHMDYLYLTG